MMDGWIVSTLSKGSLCDADEGQQPLIIIMSDRRPTNTKVTTPFRRTTGMNNIVKNRSLLSFAQEEEEEEDAVPLLKVKMRQDARPLSIPTVDSAAKRSKPEPSTATLSANNSTNASNGNFNCNSTAALASISASRYSKDSLEELRRSQNFAPAMANDTPPLPPMGMASEQRERALVSSVRDLQALQSVEGIELCGDAAEAFEQLQDTDAATSHAAQEGDRQRLVDKRMELQQHLQQQGNKAKRKVVSFNDAVKVTNKRDEIRVELQQQRQEPQRQRPRQANEREEKEEEEESSAWEQAVIQRGASTVLTPTALQATTSTSSISSTLSAPRLTSGVDLQDLLESLSTAADSARASAAQQERQAERLAAELSLSRHRESDLRRKMDSGVEKLNAIEVSAFESGN
jgi:hypothetical protein